MTRLAQILASRRAVAAAPVAFPAWAALELIKLIPTRSNTYINDLTLITDWLGPVGKADQLLPASPALVNLCFSWRILAIEDRTGISRAQILAFLIQKEIQNGNPNPNP